MVTEIIHNNEDDTIIYNVRFSNLTDLRDYLAGNPPINYDVFVTPESINGDGEFYGESLDRAIEYCINGYNYDFDNFLLINNELKQTCNEVTDNRKMVRSLYGGIPLSPLVACGVPDCMIKYDRDSSAVVRNVYFSLSYPSRETEDAIVNRGLAVLNIVRALESRGEIVNFKAFELSCCINEILNIEISLKKPGDLFLDVEKCYFPIKGKEFLRRILFRVLESVPVKEKSWFHGYGRTFSSDGIKKFYNTKSSDLIISSPSEMGILGDNIYDDTISMIESLNLEKEFDIQKIKKIGSKKI